MKTTFKSIFFGVFVLTSFSNIAAANIVGKFADASHNGKLVYLQALSKDENKYINIDSTVVKDGSFKFSALATDTPKVRLIALDSEHRPALIILEKGQIEITVDTLLKVSVKGTPLNIAYQDCQDKNDILNQKGRAIFLKLQDSKSKGELTNDIYKESLKERLNLLDTYEKNIIELIKTNAQNPVGEYLFLEARFYLRPEKMGPLFNLLRPDFRKSERVQIMENRSLACERTAVGKPFSDVKGVDINGKATALSDYVGKGSFVLLDFWASWCGPCRERIPEIKSLYEKYKNKGLVIVGISLDANMDDWKKATADENILWPQLSNLKGWDEDAAIVYGVHSIPQLMLVDKNGIIIDRDLSCDYYALGFKLSEIFR